MNRRNFLASGTLVASALSLVPTSVFANNNTISIFSLGNGFNSISNQLQHISITFLPQNLREAHKRLMQELDDKSYQYNHAEVVKLNTNCYVIPLSKKPLIGFNSKELALLIEHKGLYKHHILNERITTAFSSLIENFSENSDAHGLNLDTFNFISPKEIIKETFGKESTFVYKNTVGNHITLKGSSKKQLVIIS